MEFNKYQKEVIELNDGVHACLATAGSGKTEILTERLYKALDSGIEASKMLCLTFTNRAALSMQERVGSKLGDDFNGVFIGNTHALALNILQTNKYYPFNFSLCTADVAESLWRLAETMAIDKLTAALPPRLLDKDNQEIGSYIEKWVDESPYEEFENIKKILFSKYQNQIERLGVDTVDVEIHKCRELLYKIIPDALSVKSDNFNKFNFHQLYCLLKPLYVGGIQGFLEETPSYLDFVNDKIEILFNTETLAQKILEKKLLLYFSLYIAEQYENLKKYLLQYDFDDALSSSLTIKPAGYDWVQIDECQDLSPIQWKILSHHASNNAHIVMFGDINQSIYRFLGASVEVTTHKLGDSIKELPINYRSPKNLVEFFTTYMKKNFPERFSFDVTSNNPPTESALVWIDRESEKDQMDVLYKHAKKLAVNGKKSAFLCSTNRAVQDMSQFLREQNVEHFCVSQNDILTSKNALDFFSFIKAYNDHSDTLSWARLLWNLGNVQNKIIESTGTLLPPQIHALSIVSELSKRKTQLSDIINGQSIYDHMLCRFNSAIQNEYIYFDTETTGLNEFKDNVIQLAGVKVKESIENGVLDLYCLSDKAVGESAEIHKITDNILQAKGSDFNTQIKAFFEFTDSNPIIAHNLKFDLKMLNQNILRNNPENLQALTSLEVFCTLEVARRLYPHLKSHKLGDLLDVFKLEGVNSHNALDDVKAGANFVEYIKPELSNIVENIDSFLNEHEGLFTRFKDKISSLFSMLGESLSSKNEVSLSDLFDFYFEYIKNNNLYNLKTDRLDELRRKLINWDRENLSPAPLDVYIGNLSSKIQNLKESDLITESDFMVASTIHKAKGLEFDYVILPSVVDGKIPFFSIGKMPQSAEKDMLMEEQKRLLYVAMTRAKKQLVIGTFQLSRYGKQTQCKFLEKLLPEMTKF